MAGPAFPFPSQPTDLPKFSQTEKNGSKIYGLNICDNCKYIAFYVLKGKGFFEDVFQGSPEKCRTPHSITLLFQKNYPINITSLLCEVFLLLNLL